MNKKYLKNIILISIIHIIVYIFLGCGFGFLENSNKDGLILKNIFVQIIPIIIIEIIREEIVKKIKKRRWSLVFLTIILVLLEIKYFTLFNLFGNREGIFKYVCSTIIPLIAYSSLYTFLDFKGLFSVTLFFRVFYRIAVINLPFLPNTDWFVVGTLSIILATFIYVIFKFEKQNLDEKQSMFFEKISFFIPLVFCIIFVLFMLGVFKYEPIAIVSNSMLPVFSNGDVVIYKKLNDYELKEIPEDSIIVYKLGNHNVVHRVVERIEESEKVLYKTKGDSNNMPDIDFVEISQIKGLYAFHIKYIGFPSVWLYEYFENW